MPNTYNISGCIFWQGISQIRPKCWCCAYYRKPDLDLKNQINAHNGIVTYSAHKHTGTNWKNTLQTIKKLPWHKKIAEHAPFLKTCTNHKPAMSW